MSLNEEEAESENRILIQALRDILDPLGYLRRYAESQGRQLSGAAYDIAQSVALARQIARDALKSIGADL